MMFSVPASSNNVAMNTTRPVPLKCASLSRARRLRLARFHSF
jgi:hypothetical protein